MAGHIVPDDRLLTLAQLAVRCRCLADIGCDHGRLAAYMLQQGICETAVMTDISAPSLSKAKNLFERLGLSDRAAFRVGDGAFALQETPDVAVIAGMGGQLIASIVEKGQAVLKDARLVLQPNVAVADLRITLQKCGYMLEDERIVRDGNRLYITMAAVCGNAQYSPQELTVGPVLLKTKPPLLGDYARFRLRVARKALAGALSGNDAAAVQALQAEAKLWEELV